MIRRGGVEEVGGGRNAVKDLRHKGHYHVFLEFRAPFAFATFFQAAGKVRKLQHFEKL